MSTKPMASSRKTMHTARTSSDDDDDPTSSSGSSSSESEDEADDSEEEDELMDRTTSTAATAAGATTSSTSIPSIPGRPKPRIHRMEGGSELLSRLSAFLPKMKDANEDLEREITAGRAKDMVLDDVNDEDGKDYIEMNLGLGVLEEKRGENESSGSGDESDGDHTGSRAESARNSKKTDSDVLDTLMGGRQSAADKPSIEEMGE